MPTGRNSAPGMGVGEPGQQNAEQVLQDIYRTLKRTQAQLVGSNGNPQDLPPSLRKFLLRLIKL
jgi:hypothetical protein